MELIKYVTKFYALPLNAVLGLIGILFAIWAVLEAVFLSKKKLRKVWKCFNSVLCAVAVLLIIKMTLWGRTVSSRELELRPLYTLTTISYNNEAIRTMLMNVMLFVPFGLTLPYVMEIIPIKKNRYRWIYV